MLAAVRARLHHRGDQVDHPGAGERGHQPGRRARPVGHRDRATARSTSAIWAATSHSTSSRAPAGLARPVTRASWPSAQSKAYASCQPTSATSPTSQAGTVPAATGAARATTVDRDAASRGRGSTSVSTVGASPSRCATSAITAPSRWLTASL